MRSVFCVLVVAVSAGCSVQPPLPSLEEREAFDAWLYSAFSKVDLRTAASIKAIATLIDESAVPYSATHAEGRWNVTSYRFKGLKIVALVQEAPPQKSLVEVIEITSPAWPLDNGLAVGAPLSDIRMPIPPSQGALKFCGVNNCIEFGKKAGRISRITLSLYAE